ncbi:MAG: hypothetical protein DYH14_08115, partial [Betaproteobacteria bacterium PRO3]|nr:hypothetical protein [Betaproteobacteria bacterium PRO3]
MRSNGVGLMADLRRAWWVGLQPDSIRADAKQRCRPEGRPTESVVGRASARQPPRPGTIAIPRPGPSRPTPPAMNLWPRIKQTLARWFGGGAPAPGHYVGGAAFAWRGWLASSPWVWPRRKWRMYVPAGASRFRAMPLVVLLHGCRQSPEDIAKGTRIEALADKLCAYVLMPRQHERANPYRCWNWFDPATIAGRGEAAIVLAAMRKAMRWRSLDASRTAAIGMSAGAALATILGVRHADRVRAVVSV